MSLGTQQKFTQQGYIMKPLASELHQPQAITAQANSRPADTNATEQLRIGIAEHFFKALPADVRAKASIADINVTLLTDANKNGVLEDHEVRDQFGFTSFDVSLELLGKTYSVLDGSIASSRFNNDGTTSFDLATALENIAKSSFAPRIKVTPKMNS